jgi:hypothetical protein
MLSPIISRLTQVPIEMFDYLAFEILWQFFIIAYLILLWWICQKERLNENQQSRNIIQNHFKIYVLPKDKIIFSELEKTERWILLW